MAKKNFTDGLDNLFKENTHEEEVTLIPEQRESGTKTKPAKQKKKKSSKDFTADLDTLLQEALQESVQEHSAKKKSPKTPVAKTKGLQRTKRIKRTLSGLDALIRQTLTVSESEEETSPALPKKKRVTFSFDREKVDKLKQIARMEKSYIKDIVSSIVSEYIEEYERSKNK